VSASAVVVVASLWAMGATLPMVVDGKTVTSVDGWGAGDRDETEPSRGRPGSGMDPLGEFSTSGSVSG
jgi:hypothetical protein